jgi:ketosteroid isomerase-like protein
MTMNPMHSQPEHGNTTPHPAGLLAAEQDIRQARAAQTLALAAFDHDLVASFWADDITVRRALGHAVSGAAACRLMLDAGAAASPPIVYQREAVSVTVSAQWPLAFEEGRWTGHAGPADSPAVMGGRYAAQWVRRSGRWLIRSEIFVALSGSGVGLDFVALP